VSNPEAWEDQLNAILGENFPYFITMGEDDAAKYFANNGYQERAEDRMNRLGITWDGSLGAKSSFVYQGIFFIQTAAGISAANEDNYDDYIEDQLQANNSLWRISTFHKNQTKMQLCGHGNVTGWQVYERSREGGAIIMSGQCHVYARTHLLSDMSRRDIVSTSDTLTLAADLPATSADEGQTFALVSGLGGRSIHKQETDGAWWATKYTRKQDATYGALFGVFNFNGIPNLAQFYFKNIDGDIIETFYVKSAVTGDFGLTVNTAGSGNVNVSPQAPVFDAGTQVTLTANPLVGWTFTGWSGDLTGTQNPAIITMDDHKVITATFAPPEYTLTVNTQGSGTVDATPLGDIHIEGTVVTLTASPASGFTFSGWTGDISGSQNPLSLTMDSDKTINASFIENEPPIAINDSYSIDEDQSLIVAVPGLLDNDSDPDADVLQTSLVSGPTDGALTLNSDGSFTYAPNPNFMGSDGFTYLVSDGRGGGRL